MGQVVFIPHCAKHYIAVLGGMSMICHLGPCNQRPLPEGCGMVRFEGAVWRGMGCPVALGSLASAPHGLAEVAEW